MNEIKARISPNRFLEHFAPATEQEKPPFAPMLQGMGTNKLSQISTRSATPTVDAITGVATIAAGDFKVFIEQYNTLAGGLRISTHKLLDACSIALTSQSHYRGTGELNTVVSIPLEDYMTMCGTPVTKPSKDKTRRRVHEDLETLYNLSIEWKEKSGKNTRDYQKMRVITSHGIQRGMIIVGFSPELADYLTHAYIMQYPTALLKVDERNPNSYHVGRKLLLHHSIENNRRRGTANLISVSILLEACPNIPSYTDVMRGDRHVDQQIVTPLENALNALPFITWEYSNAKGVALSENQLKKGSFADFITLYIHFTVKDLPDHSGKHTVLPATTF